MFENLPDFVSRRVITVKGEAVDVVIKFNKAIGNQEACSILRRIILEIQKEK